MFKQFAQPIEIAIPIELQPHLLMCIHAYTEEFIEVSYPMFASGYPLLIHNLNKLPIIYANGSAAVPSSSICLAGQIYDCDIVMEYKSTIDTLGLMLHPLAPYYLFHKPAETLINKWNSLEDFEIEGSLNFYQILNSQAKVNDRVLTIFSFLKVLLKNRLPAITWLDEAVNNILRHNGNVEVNQLIEASGISARHFRRQFKKIVGMPPKVYCKVLQLNNVFRMIEQNQEEQLLAMALDSGFYDQSHFISTFKKSIGQSPTKFLNSEHAFLSSYMGLDL